MFRTIAFNALQVNNNDAQGVRSSIGVVASVSTQFTFQVKFSASVSSTLLTQYMNANYDPSCGCFAPETSASTLQVCVRGQGVGIAQLAGPRTLHPVRHQTNKASGPIVTVPALHRALMCRCATDVADVGHCDTEQRGTCQWCYSRTAVRNGGWRYEPNFSGPGNGPEMCHSSPNGVPTFRL